MRGLRPGRANIVAVTRNEEGLTEVARAVEGQGRRCFAIRADLGDEGQTAAARRALADWGVIDILVNSAGISRLNPATEITLEQWEETMAVNLRAPS
jgi:3-oxoacyl-[acyl-carrier protein] reductase